MNYSTWVVVEENILSPSKQGDNNPNCTIGMAALSANFHTRRGRLLGTQGKRAGVISRTNSPAAAKSIEDNLLTSKTPDR